MSAVRRGGFASWSGRVLLVRLNRGFRRLAPAATRARHTSTFGAEPLERRVLLSSDVPDLATGSGVDVANVGAASVPPASETADAYTDLTSTSRGKAFFTAYRSPVGRELWVTDGTPAGTRLVKDIRPGGASSMPIALTDVDGTLFFFANDGVHGFEPWKSDGTEAGTVMVKDVVPGPVGSNAKFVSPNPYPYMSSGAMPGAYLFTTTDFSELWRSDGTADGTYRLKEAGALDDLHANWGYPGIGLLGTANGVAYFKSSDPDIGSELWVTDGTVAGTRLVKDIVPGKDWSDPSRVVAGVNGITYFTAVSKPLDYPTPAVSSLFRTDGTAAGTVKVFDGPEALYDVQALNGLTYFVPKFPLLKPTQLWRTDGTPQGTAKALEFPPPTDPLTSYDAAVSIEGMFHGQLLLNAYKEPTGFEYFLTDGTQAGLRPVTESLGVERWSIHRPQVINDQLYFYMSGPTGSEPYRSDGTPGGTVLLNDIVPGIGSSEMGGGTFVPAGGGRVVFNAFLKEPVTIVTDPTKPWGSTTYYYFGLYGTDGTAGSAERLPVVAFPPGPPASVVGRHVFYAGSAFDPAAGGAAGAVAPDKQALLPGQTGGFANVTGYDRGLNGIMVDIAGVPPGVTLWPDDFVIRTGASASPAGLAAAPPPPVVTLRRGKGDGGSDRVTLIWPQWAAVKNGWLQVTVKANAETGLAVPDVFYFGNLVGETGDALTPLRVSSADLAGVKRYLNASVGIGSPYDVNHDGRVNALDLGIVRGSVFRQLVPIAPPDGGTGASVAGVAGATSLLHEG